VTDPDLVPAEGDTPGPFATPAQDADVRALLGTLRAEDVPMPDDVVRRINAAVVAERVASTLPDSPAALVDADDAEAGGGSLTVLPTPQERRARSSRGFSMLLAAAAAVVVVVGVGAMVTRSGGLGGSTASGGAASAAPETAGGAVGRVSDSGSAYSATGLSAQVKSLVGGQAPAVSSPTSDTGSEPTPTGSRSALYAAAAPTGAVLDRCLQLLTTSATPPAPVAVDSGTYEGKPALVVVLPTEDDPASLDVFVVAPGCGTAAEPDLYEFQRIAR
jgi:hypothetical protein